MKSDIRNYYKRHKANHRALLWNYLNSEPAPTSNAVMTWLELHKVILELEKIQGREKKGDQSHGIATIWGMTKMEFFKAETS